MTNPQATTLKSDTLRDSTTGLKKVSLNKDTSKTDINISSRNKKPLLIKCLPRPDFEGGMMFYCFHCATWHLHGRHEGYRVTHCSNRESPLHGNDIKIKMISLAELKEIRDGINNWLRLPPEKRRAYQK